jgi:hypothetical protein
MSTQSHLFEARNLLCSPPPPQGGVGQVKFATSKHPITHTANIPSSQQTLKDLAIDSIVWVLKSLPKKRYITSRRKLRLGFNENKCNWTPWDIVN